MPLILQHAQEKNRSIIKSHIKLYVNKETEGFSDKGKEAIRTFMALESPL